MTLSFRNLTRAIIQGKLCNVWHTLFSIEYLGTNVRQFGASACHKWVTLIFLFCVIQVLTGFVHHELQKIPGLFQNFQGPFLQFSRTKNLKLAADFHRNDSLITALRSVAPGKINGLNFVGKSGSLH